MRKFNLLILTLLILIPQAGWGVDFPFFSQPEKEAQTFVNKVIPEILENWEKMILIRYAHPEFCRNSSQGSLDTLFFSYKMLGRLQSCQAAQGEIVEVKPTAGKKYLTGRYTVEADFEKGKATILISIIKEGRQWMITSFQVNSEAFQSLNNAPQTSPTQDNKLSLEEMKKTAGEFLKDTDIVSRRHGVEAIYLIAGKMDADGEKQMALQLYEKALESDPANFQEQLKFARLLLTGDKKEKALVVLHMIHDLAEDTNILMETEKILATLKASPHSQPFTASGNTEIILVPVGDVNIQLLQELCPKLQKQMGMAVGIDNNVISANEPDRKLSDRYTSEVFTNITSNISTLQRGTIIASLGLDENALLNPSHQSRFILKFFSLLGENGKNARQSYETNLEQISKEVQYDSERLIKELRQAVPFDRYGKAKAIIGVTREDLYMGEGNFVYGGTSWAYGIISTYRFSSAMNHEKQNRPRLISRLLKQALSSVNFALGIPRCSTPSCARAFPQNITEHDAKGEGLCDECKNRLKSFKEKSQNINMGYEYLALGEKYRNEKKWDQSIAFYKKGIQYQAERASTAYYGIGEIYLAQGRYHDADQAFKTFLDQLTGKNTTDEIISTLTFIGDRFLEHRQTATAHYYFSQVIKLDEKNVKALVYVGDLHTEKKEYDKAKEFYQRAIDVDPEGCLANLGMAIFLHTKGASISAIQYYEKVLSLPCSDINQSSILSAMYHLSNLYLKQGVIHKAEEQLEKALVMNPEFTLALDSLGKIYSEGGRLDKGIEQYKKSLELQPDNADTWNNLGYTYYLKKEYRTAISQYEKALQINQNSGLYHYNKSLAHFALEEFDPAIEDVDKAKKYGYEGSQKFHNILNQHRK